MECVLKYLQWNVYWNASNWICTEIPGRECVLNYLQWNVYWTTCNGICTELPPMECVLNYLQWNVYWTIYSGMCIELPPMECVLNLHCNKRKLMCFVIVRKLPYTLFCHRGIWECEGRVWESVGFGGGEGRGERGYIYCGRQTINAKSYPPTFQCRSW